MELSDFIMQMELHRKEQDNLYHRVAAHFGLTDTTMLVLYLVSDTKVPCTQQELCRRSFYAKQTINTALSALVRQGCATLEPISGSRKQKQILLTGKGQALASRTTELLREAELRAYGTLAPGQLDAYLATTEAITAALRKEFTNLITQGDQT